MNCFMYIVEWLRPWFQRDKNSVEKEEPYLEL